MVWYICLKDAWGEKLRVWRKVFLTVDGTQGTRTTLEMIVKSLLVHLGNLLSAYCIPGPDSSFLSSNHQNGEGQKEVALGFNHLFVYHHASVCMCLDTWVPLYAYRVQSTALGAAPHLLPYLR